MKKILLSSLSILFFASLLFTSVFATESETKTIAEKMESAETVDLDTNIETETDIESNETDTESDGTGTEISETEPKASSVMIVLYPNEYRLDVYPNSNSKNIRFKIEWKSKEKEAEYDSNKTEVTLGYDKSASVLTIRGFYNTDEFYTLSLNLSNLPKISISESKTLGNAAEIKYSGFPVRYPVIITNGYQTISDIYFQESGKTNIGIPNGINEVNVKLSLKNNVYAIYTYTGDNDIQDKTSKAKLILDENYNGISTTDAKYTISGTALNASALYLNGNEIVREYTEGRFQIDLDLVFGENTFTLSIEDENGKTTSTVIKITRTSSSDNSSENDINNQQKKGQIKTIIFCILSASVIIFLLVFSTIKRHNRKNA